jgi:hypothetical protein
MLALRAAARRALAALACCSFLGAGCGQSALALMPGVVNDPKNVSLRRSILSYGLKRLCAELQKRTLPLRFRDQDPAIGRFYPVRCAAKELPDGDQYVELAGHGYAWTDMSQRLGFEAGANVVYDTDLRLDGSTMYVYFRPRSSTPVTFTTRMVEQPQAAFLGGLPIGPGGQKLTDAFGAQIMAHEIARGFTVIRASDGNVEYGLGMVAPGEHPTAPYKNLDRGLLVLANERSELHPNQRDYVGPFQVTGGKLTLVVSVDGTPAADVLLVPRSTGEPWLAAYILGAATGPPPGPSLLDEAVTAGLAFRRTLSVPAGQYYLVLDNTATAGRATPAGTATVSYAIEVEQ